MRWEKPICVPPRLSEVSPSLPLKQFQCSSDGRWPLSSFQGRSSSASSEGTDCGKQTVGNSLQLTDCGSFVVVVVVVK